MADSETAAPANEDDSPLEEAARQQLGLRWWDRPALYRETAEAATDSDLPFWAVLLLSGAIASLGLTLNSTAVVIGAMLVAPLLGPLMGLSMSLAVGDGRLFLQTAATVLLGAIGIIALSALLTAVLPFQTVTDEIAARTRPTTLDLAIAVFSGLAGAVVTASRESRLSASIPGVAVAVALVPPLGVAGFGVGTGWRWSFIEGALLLFGANLAGIVLSGLGVFLLVGMHRDDIVGVARSWHQEEKATGLAARLAHVRVLDRTRVLSAPWARVALVVGFMAAVAVPLSTSLAQVVRESRVSTAADNATSGFDTDQRETTILDREIVYGDSSVTVRLRVATTDWIDAEAKRSYAEAVSAASGEPVNVDLEQVLVSSGDLDTFAEALPTPAPVRTDPKPSETAPFPATLDAVRGRLGDALAGLALPDSVAVLDAETRVDVADGPATVRLVYAAPRRLPPEAASMLSRQLARALGVAPEAVRPVAIETAPRALPDSAGVVRLGALLRRYPRLSLEVRADSASAASARARLGAERVRYRVAEGPARVGLVVRSDSTAGA